MAARKKSDLQKRVDALERAVFELERDMRFIEVDAGALIHRLIDKEYSADCAGWERKGLASDWGIDGG